MPPTTPQPPLLYHLICLQRSRFQSRRRGKGWIFFSVSVGQVVIMGTLGEFLLAVRLWVVGDICPTE